MAYFDIIVGDWLRKSIHLEENQGLRELSYLSFSFNWQNVGQIMCWCVIPATLFMVGLLEEKVSISSSIVSLNILIKLELLIFRIKESVILMVE